MKVMSVRYRQLFAIAAAFSMLFASSAICIIQAIQSLSLVTPFSQPSGSAEKTIGKFCCAFEHSLSVGYFLSVSRAEPAFNPFETISQFFISRVQEDF